MVRRTAAEVAAAGLPEVKPEEPAAPIPSPSTSRKNTLRPSKARLTN